MQDTMQVFIPEPALGIAADPGGPGEAESPARRETPETSRQKHQEQLKSACPDEGQAENAARAALRRAQRLQMTRLIFPTDERQRFSFDLPLPLSHEESDVENEHQ